MKSIILHHTQKKRVLEQHNGFNQVLANKILVLIRIEKHTHCEQRAEKISNLHISHPYVSPCFSSLCFAILSYYFPFNSTPLIWVLFSFIERCLVNKGRRKAIKTDGFLINRKLPRDTRGISYSLKPF